MKVGIIGCGRIARTMADTINNTKGFELYAVAARDIERANAFKEEFNASVSYGSYEELVSDDNVELVYVATPHSLHKDHMLLCLEHNKPILCEKAFTVNEAEAKEVLDLAKEKGLFVGEAIWTRYMPSRKLIDKIIDEGKIGKVTSITANLGYQISDKERIIDPKLGGGALLDIGIYPLNFALMARNNVNVKALTGVCTKAETGVDLQDSMVLCFEDGSIATIFADAEITSDRRGYIYGTKGYIEVENINNPEVIRVYDNSRNPFMNTEIIIKKDYNGYEYELIEAKKCIEEGKIESEMMSHKETLRVMRFMDAFRASWGVKLSNEV
ncbi:MAG: Gfo/Idh/MocA family oxidoreductase [Spirochaetales bacterium]|nr:Gfo/Idh/MocA family oxidoreductase [Spirochaetales bacterium]